MTEKFIKLKPLVSTGDFKKQPPDCKCAFADSKCIKRVHNNKCPSNCLETGACGGWGPRTGLPERSRVDKKK